MLALCVPQSGPLFILRRRCLFIMSREVDSISHVCKMNSYFITAHEADAYYAHKASLHFVYKEDVYPLLQESYHVSIRTVTSFAPKTSTYLLYPMRQIPIMSARWICHSLHEPYLIFLPS